jgi:signal transduction histidine kinase
MNPAAGHFLGVTAGEEIGKRSADTGYLCISGEVRTRNYDVALTGNSIQYARFNPKLERWFETRSFSPRHGQFAQVFTDITERKKTEEAVRNLSVRLLRVQDETQRRLARQLHETVAQSLAAIKMNLAVVRRLPGDDPRGAEALENVFTATDEALTEIRTVTYLLHPPMIDHAGLITALRWYIDGFQRRSGIATVLDAPDDPGPLSPDIETSVFRIVQEGLTNVQRHSGSATANVSISRQDHQLSVEIADQGRGVPPAMREDHDALLASGVGIAGINERVHELRGGMTIDSSEAGTAVRVTIPLSPSDAGGAEDERRDEQQ